MNVNYEYSCDSCGAQYMIEQKFGSDAVKICPSCKNETAKRLISGPSPFILKGGGWASDLYSNAKKDQLRKNTRVCRKNDDEYHR